MYVNISHVNLMNVCNFQCIGGKPDFPVARWNSVAPERRTKTNQNKNCRLRQLPNILEELELGAPIPKGQRGFSFRAEGIEKGRGAAYRRLAQRVSTTETTTIVATDHNASRQSGVGRSTNTSVLFGKWPPYISVYICIVSIYIYCICVCVCMCTPRIRSLGFLFYFRPPILPTTATLLSAHYYTKPRFILRWHLDHQHRNGSGLTYKRCVRNIVVVFWCLAVKDKSDLPLFRQVMNSKRRKKKILFFFYWRFSKTEKFLIHHQTSFKEIYMHTFTDSHLDSYQLCSFLTTFPKNPLFLWKIIFSFWKNKPRLLIDVNNNKIINQWKYFLLQKSTGNWISFLFRKKVITPKAHLQLNV